jgi:S-DNA-T family DNA segregation ATPase FtsK/SpoIIIE
VQGVFLTDEEVQRVTEFVSAQAVPMYDDAFVLLESAQEGGFGMGGASDDPLYEEVKEYVIQDQKASTSLLQRRFGIGYNRAARMIDLLEENGVIGPARGSKPREVFLKPEESSNRTETGGTW